MAKNNNKFVDANGVEFTITPDDFKLVQLDTKIHDQKFDTKPTTFFKDALRRFRKNHSSVVGAVIILIIVLLAIFVPMISPYDVSGSHANETLLLPKLFDAGTGFWDGTQKVTGQPYDENSPTGVNQETFLPNAVSNVVVYEKDGMMYVDFTYDVYEAKYGVLEKTIYKVEIDKYVANGWCEYEYNGNGEYEFKVLDEEKCPIIEIVTANDDGDVVAKVQQYKYLGYDKMPRYIFGTDNLGRDLLKRSFEGMRYSLVFAIVITVICFVFGLVWGAISGYFGGNVDLFLERFKDILGGVPLIVIVTLFRLHLGDKLWVFALALCITGWMGTAARTRTQFYRFKGREYVLASRTLGASDNRLIFRHILPNAMGTIITSSVLMVPSLIFTEATLSYLGLGLNGSNSFGNILSENQQYLQTYPMLIVVPAIIISLLMISFNLFGNGLRDAFNPSLKGSE